MSAFDSDDLETTGYFLPEDSQLRLKKLHEYITFLSHVAQSRGSDGVQEWVPEIRVGEVAVCLELLAEQLERVLGDISWPAKRGEQEVAEGDAEPVATDEVTGAARNRRLYGLTLEQVDRLNQLFDIISAHGDVVIASDEAEFARHTLSVLGHAICCDMETVRGIIGEAPSFMPVEVRDTQTGVGEERATYLARPACLPLDSTAQGPCSTVASLLGTERFRCRPASGLGIAHAKEATYAYH